MKKRAAVCFRRLAARFEGLGGRRFPASIRRKGAGSAGGLYSQLMYLRKYTLRNMAGVMPVICRKIRIKYLLSL